MGIKLDLEVQDIDFVINRLTAGQMEFNVAMRAQALMIKIQTQANDPNIQGKVAAPSEKSPVERKEPTPPGAAVKQVAKAAKTAVNGAANATSGSAA